MRKVQKSLCGEPDGVTTHAVTIINAKIANCTITGESVDKTGYVMGTVNAGTKLTTPAVCAG